MIDIPERYRIVLDENNKLDKNVEDNRSAVDFGLAVLLQNLEDTLISTVDRIVTSLNRIDKVEDKLDPKNVLEAKQMILKSINKLIDVSTSVNRECHNATYKSVSGEDITFAYRSTSNTKVVDNNTLMDDKEETGRFAFVAEMSDYIKKKLGDWLSYDRKPVITNTNEPISVRYPADKSISIIVAPDTNYTVEQHDDTKYATTESGNMIAAVNNIFNTIYAIVVRRNLTKLQVDTDLEIIIRKLQDYENANN